MRNKTEVRPQVIRCDSNCVLAFVLVLIPRNLWKVAEPADWNVRAALWRRLSSPDVSGFWGLPVPSSSLCSLIFIIPRPTVASRDEFQC